MTTLRSLSLLLALAVAPACSSSEAAPTAPNAPTAQRASSDTDYQALCVETMQRNRACTDTYIPALVDARARHDNPPGIAAEVAANRDAVIAEANREWASDSTDEAIAAMCQKLGGQPSADDRANADTIRACLAETECSAYTACVMPVFEKRFVK